MGRPESVTRPMMTVMIEITMATMGRLMKNLYMCSKRRRANDEKTKSYHTRCRSAHLDTTTMPLVDSPHDGGVGRGQGSTAIELGACCSKHDFFDPPLKMIRTIQRQLRPGRFALGPHGDSSAQEQTLELFNYLLDR